MDRLLNHNLKNTTKGNDLKKESALVTSPILSMYLSLHKTRNLRWEYRIGLSDPLSSNQLNYGEKIHKRTINNTESRYFWTDVPIHTRGNTNASKAILCGPCTGSNFHEYTNPDFSHLHRVSPCVWRSSEYHGINERTVLDNQVIHTGDEVLMWQSSYLASLFIQRPLHTHIHGESKPL